MSWLYSQVLVAEYLAGTCSDGAQSAPLSGNPTQLAYLPPDRMTAFSRLSRFGMTFKPLTDTLGAELLTLYLAAFPAKTSVQQDEAPESTASAADCGSIWRESLGKYDPSTHTLKTAQCSLFEDSTSSSPTLPRWGSMRTGELYRQQTLVRPTGETESGCWVGTPTATMSVRSEEFAKGRLPQPAEFVRQWPTPLASNTKAHHLRNGGRPARSYLWPTPTASDNRPRGTQNSTARRMALGKQVGLEAMVKWSTPTAHNAIEAAYPSEYLRVTPTLAAQAGGALNPEWVEWLMGWPLGWTGLKPLEMAKFQQWLQQHGVY